MNRYMTAGLSVVAGAALGAAAIQGLHAQAKPPVFVVNDVTVADPAAFATYAEAQGALIAKNGGHFIIRGGTITPIQGTPPQRFTVYVFPTMAQMQAWRDAPEQKDLMASRDKAGKFISFAVEGCADCAPPPGK